MTIHELVAQLKSEIECSPPATNENLSWALKNMQYKRSHRKNCVKKLMLTGAISSVKLDSGEPAGTKLRAPPTASRRHGRSPAAR